MKLKTKRYKFEKVKAYLKNPIFVILNIENVNKLRLKGYSVKNSFASTVFKNSIFYNFKYLFISPVTFLKVDFKDVTKLKHLNIIGIKINKKMYSGKQLRIIDDLCYKKNVKNFSVMLNKLIIKSYLKLFTEKFNSK